MFGNMQKPRTIYVHKTPGFVYLEINATNLPVYSANRIGRLRHEIGGVSDRTDSGSIPSELTARPIRRMLGGGTYAMIASVAIFVFHISPPHRQALISLHRTGNIKQQKFLYIASLCKGPTAYADFRSPCHTNARRFTLTLPIRQRVISLR
jgi:hypothetical protein